MTSRRLLAILLCVVIILARTAAAALAQAGQNPPGTATAGAAPASNLPGSFTTEDTRMTVGTSSNIASGQTQNFNFLLDFALTAPLSKTPVSRTSKPAIGVWFDLRLSGQAQQATPSVKQFVGGFENNVVSGSITDVVQTADVLGGLEVRLRNGFDFGHDYQLEPLLIFGGGFVTTPPRTGALPVFALTDEARAAYIPTDTPGRDAFKYLAFTDPDKHSFDWQYYVGLRLRSHHFRHCDGVTTACSPDARLNFPGTIDISVGVNSAVSGGQRGKMGAVARLEAFYPLPTDNLANAIYFFGSANLHLSRIPDASVIFLAAPSATVAVPSPDLFIHQLTPAERRRDSWQFGVAVDLVRVFKGIGKVNEAAAAAPAPGSTVIANDDLEIRRVIIKKSDSAALSSTIDLFIPLTGGVLEQHPVAHLDRVNSRTFVAGEPQFIGAQTLKNSADTAFEALVVHPISSVAAPTMPGELTLTNATRVTHDSSDQLVLDVFDLKAGGSVTGGVAGRSTLVIATDDATLKTKTGSDAEQSTTLAKGVPKVVPKQTTLTVTTTKDARILVIAIK